MAIGNPYQQKKPPGIGANVKAAVQGYKPTAVTSPVTPPGVGPNVAAAVQGYKPPVTGVGANPASGLATAMKPTVAPPTAQQKAMTPFGGQDAYISSQLNRYNTETPDMQGRIATDLGRFGVTPKTKNGTVPAGVNSTFLQQGDAANTVKLPTAADKALQPFGGQDAYIQKQLERYKGENAAVQGKINKDLERFGVSASPITGKPEQAGFSANSLVGATLGGDANGQYFQLPDGSREWIDTPQEAEIANQISSYQANSDAIKALQASGLQQNQSDYDYVTNQLNQREAVDEDRAQQVQNRFGGLYSGGLQYQLGGIDRGYAEQRGQLAQQFQRANQELQAKYGAQTQQMADSLRNLLSTAPSMINQQIAEAVAAKNEAAMQQSKELGIPYYSVENEQNFSRIMELKQLAEQKGITKAQRDAYSQEADQLRYQLAKGGVDISKIGAGSNLATASQQSFGVKTAEQRDDEYKQSRDALTDEWKISNETGVISDYLSDYYGIAKGLPTMEAAQQAEDNLWRVAEQIGTIPDELADMYGFQRGMDTQRAYEFAQNLAMKQDSAKLALAKAEGAGTKSISGAQAGTLLANSLKKTMTGNDGKTRQGTITDPTKREQAFLAAVQTSGVQPGNDVLEMVIKAGFTEKEIALLKNTYPEFFNQVSGGVGPGSVDLSKGVTGNSTIIDTYAKQYGVDPSLVKAIIQHETGNMTSNAAKSKNNFGGIMGEGGLRTYDSAEEGIEAVAKLLSTDRYRDKSISQIGAIYAPVGASNDPTNLNSNWVKGVTKFYNQYK